MGVNVKKRFFIVPDFSQTDIGIYEKRMDEELLVDLIGGIDVSLLEENFIQKDIDCNRGMILSAFYQKRAKTFLSEKFDIKIEAVKNKVSYLTGIISGIAAAVLLLAGVIVWFLKKAAIQSS